MAAPILIIKSNAGETSDVLIKDMGIYIPLGGGSIQLDRYDELLLAQQSINLRAFLVDGQFGPDSHTLTLNNGSVDIPSADAEAFLNALTVPDQTNAYGALKRSGNGGFDAKSLSISNVADPSSDQDVANKRYVDSVAQGLDPKQSVRALSDLNIMLSGTQTVDGVALQADDRVLLAGQTDPIENGIWVVKEGAWTRPDDFKAGDMVAGAFAFVEEGDVYADSGHVVTSDQGGGGASYDWTVGPDPEDDFATLEAAVAGAADGDTIQVKAGVYTPMGELVIDKELQIYGDDKTNTIIEGFSGLGESLIRVEADNVSLQRMSITQLGLDDNFAVSGETTDPARPGDSVKIQNFSMVDCEVRYTKHGVSIRGANTLIKDVQFAVDFSSGGSGLGTRYALMFSHSEGTAHISGCHFQHFSDIGDNNRLIYLTGNGTNTSDRTYSGKLYIKDSTVEGIVTQFVNHDNLNGSDLELYLLNNDTRAVDGVSDGDSNAFFVGIGPNVDLYSKVVAEDNKLENVHNLEGQGKGMFHVTTGSPWSAPLPVFARNNQLGNLTLRTDVRTGENSDPALFTITTVADANFGSLAYNPYDFSTDFSGISLDSTPEGPSAAAGPGSIVDLSPLTLAQFSGAGSITAGLGLYKVGNTIDVGAGAGLIANADDIEVLYGSTFNVAELGSANLAGSLNEAARIDHTHAHGDRGFDGPASQHDADQVDVEGDYTVLGSPSDVEAAISSINDRLGDLRHSGKALQFGVSSRIPTGGRFLEAVGGVSTASAPMSMIRDGVIKGASIRVDAADSLNSYKLAILINGVEQGSLALDASATQAQTDALDIAYAAGDDLALKVESLSAGSGYSEFDDTVAYLELYEGD